MILIQECLNLISEEPATFKYIQEEVMDTLKSKSYSLKDMIPQAPPKDMKPSKKNME